MIENLLWTPFHSSCAFAICHFPFAPPAHDPHLYLFLVTFFTFHLYLLLLSTLGSVLCPSECSKYLVRRLSLSFHLFLSFPLSTYAFPIWCLGSLSSIIFHRSFTIYPVSSISYLVSHHTTISNYCLLVIHYPLSTVYCDCVLCSYCVLSTVYCVLCTVYCILYTAYLLSTP